MQADSPTPGLAGPPLPNQAYAAPHGYARGPMHGQPPQHPGHHGQPHQQQRPAPVAPTARPPHAGPPQQPPTQQLRPVVTDTTFITGAYQPSGDAGIDRMLRLEHALKRYGSPL